MDTPSDSKANVVESLIKFLKQTQAPIHHKDPKPNDIVVFLDKTVVSLENHADHPRRKRANFVAYDQASFADYVKAHKIPRTTIVFGNVNETGGSFGAVIDYHEAVEVQPPANGSTAQLDLGNPNWGSHTATLSLAFTPEWKKWMKFHDSPMAQADFADFIEDNLGDIVIPAAADLLEIAQELIAKKSVDFKSGIRLQSGQSKLVYEEKIEASGNKVGGDLQVPTEFTIVIAPFVGSEPQSITARLRFRITDGRLNFIYKLNQPHKVLERTFTAARVHIAAQTELPVLLGAASVQKQQS